jgi:energy-coupling factor transporter ATP-binding protein EcfA2
MTRWNISLIFFLGLAGQRREVELRPGEVNIITGASGTGKSALIRAIDYCLGASKCDIPVHVRRRSLAVGVKWTSGEAEILVGRVIPPVGQATSTRMFVASGRGLALPFRLEEFEGATTLNAAKAFLERAFGIGDLPEDPGSDPAGVPRGRASVRHVTPYMFVTKEVICSETVLLHGLERPEVAREIIETMPYFLRVTDETTAATERRLRQLRRALEQGEIRERARAAADSALKQRALSMLAEAHRIGLISAAPTDGAEDELLGQLQRISSTELEASAYPSEGELGSLHMRRREILNHLGAARRRARSSRTAIQELSGFESAVKGQREKLMLAEHLGLADVAETCPVCNAPSERGQKTASALQAALVKVREENTVVERVKPRLVEHDRALEQEIDSLNSDLRRVDDQIQTWLRQTEETRRLADLAQVRAHLLGRISFFLESSSDESGRMPRDLSVLRTEIAELEAQVDREAKEVKLRRAETKISNFATENFGQLPTVAPCIGSELDFSARKPEVTVIEAGSGAVLRLPDVGSDQNYLAIHIALSFGLQRYFEVSNSPVPGILVLDQISRPYFPSRGEDEDEKEIEGREEDEDVQAMRKHITFLFTETARRSGLQVLLIEHAYFADDPRFVAATRERWTRASGRGLIPIDWPARGED